MTGKVEGTSHVSVDDDIGELFLAELRSRRERLKELMRLVNLEASRGALRCNHGHKHVRRTPRISAASAHCTSGQDQREL